MMTVQCLSWDPRTEEKDISGKTGETQINLGFGEAKKCISVSVFIFAKYHSHEDVNQENWVSC